MTAKSVGGAPQDRVIAAVQQLAVAHGELANALASLTAVVAEEALENASFAVQLHDALVVGRGNGLAADPPTEPTAPASTVAPAKVRSRRGRRAPGPWDPYKVYSEVGEVGLRERLTELELEQLRDMVAEHGMNADGRAMRWAKTDRVAGRIVERVVNRAVKGDAFRDA